MTVTKQRVRETIDELEKDHDIVELSLNRGNVDVYIRTDAESESIKKLIQEELSDETILGLDVQKEAVEDFDDLIKHVNFSYRN